MFNRLLKMKQLKILGYNFYNKGQYHCPNVCVIKMCMLFKYGSN